MKKTLIALAVAALASSAANATVVYQQDGTKLDVDGRISMQVRKETNKRTDLVDKGSRVRVRAYQEIGNGFSALANMEIRFTQNGTIGDGIHTKRLFGGFAHKDIGALTFGRQLTVGDDLGLSDFTYELGAITKVVDAHNKAVHFKSADFGGFHFMADYYFGNSAKHSTRYTTTKDSLGNVTITAKSDNQETADDGQGYGLGAFYKTKVGEFGFAVEGGYSEITRGDWRTGNGDGKAEYKTKGATVAGLVSYGPVALGLDWSHAKSTKDNVDNKFRVGAKAFNQVNQFEVGLKYQITQNNKVYAEYLWGTGKTKGTENGKFRGWFLGADHYFNKNVLVYVEGGSFKTKQAGVTLEKNKQIALGTRILF
ncbi:porin [Lonepinella sp. MS14436]|uniref:porin n=1 Tax=Lonepinella sp. MS14436 TaxID=3003619 RepID=UPI0036DD3F9B